jgi:hypothetical protein
MLLQRRASLRELHPPGGDGNGTNVFPLELYNFQGKFPLLLASVRSFERQADVDRSHECSSRGSAFPVQVHDRAGISGLDTIESEQRGRRKGRELLLIAGIILGRLAVAPIAFFPRCEHAFFSPPVSLFTLPSFPP